MKFYLLSVLLLATVVLASSAPPNVTATILYSDRFVHTEGFDLHTLNYTFHMAGVTFVIETRNESGWRLPSERMVINNFGKFGQDSHFAIETFKRNPKENYRHSTFCRRHSNSTMISNLVRECEGLILIRSLTVEEKRKIKALKYQLQRKYLKTIYNRKFVNVTTSPFIGRLNFELSHNNTFDGHSRLMIDATDGVYPKYMEIRAKNERFPNGTFVVEDTMDLWDPDCRKTDLRDLKPWKCRGDIILRGYDERKDALVYP